MSPIPYERFGDNVLAHLEHLHDQPPAEVVAALERRLLDGSWVRAPTTWVNTLVVRGDRARATHRELVEGLLARTVTCMLDGPGRPESRAVLLALVNGQERLLPEQLAAVSEWLVRRGGPDDVELGATILWHVLASDDEVRWRAVNPLVAWVLENGAAELRARRWAFLHHDIVRTLVALDDTELLLPALRYMFANEQPPDLGDSRAHIPLDAVEKLLLTGRVGPTIVTDLARALPEPWLFERIVRARPHEAWGDRPALRAAVVDSLMAGNLTKEIADKAWVRVLATDPPPGVRFATPEVLASAWRAIARVTMEGQGISSADAAHVRAWTHLIVLEHLRRSEVSGGGIDPEVVESTKRMIRGIEAVDLGIEEATREYLAGSSTAGHQLAAEVLAQPAGEAKGRGRLRAALSLMAARSAAAQRDPDLGPWLDEVRRIVERVLVSTAGLDHPLGRLIAGWRSVVFARLDADDKVRLRDGTIVMDPHEMRGLASPAFTHDESSMLGAMYVVHELVHLIQGIGDKGDVTKLRATGAESTLMQVDLAADHLAARLIGPVVGQSLGLLKDLQGRALMAFPVGPTNTTAARARKAQRLVGLRLDSFLRESGALPSDADEHVFADFGPVGPWLVALASGPPVRVLGIASLPRQHAELLSSAADPATSRDAVDAVLRRCAETLARGRAAP